MGSVCKLTSVCGSPVGCVVVVGVAAVVDYHVPVVALLLVVWFPPEALVLVVWWLLV